MALTTPARIGIGIILAVLLFFGFRALSAPKPMEYSNNPADWLEPAAQNTVSVNVDEATRGKGEYNIANQQLALAGEQTAFAYEGIYRGHFFSTRYADDTGAPIMEMTPDLNPDDGVLQGFMVERFANGALETHIFVDEDWRRALGTSLSIVWGADYSRTKPFAYEPVKPGIYHDMILDDPSRMQPDISVGGVQVGNMRPGGVDPAQAAGIILMAIH